MSLGACGISRRLVIRAQREHRHTDDAEPAKHLRTLDLSTRSAKVTHSRHHVYELRAPSWRAGEISTSRSRNAPGAPSGTTGLFGAVGGMRRYACPCSVRLSLSPLLGHIAAARPV